MYGMNDQMDCNKSKLFLLCFFALVVFAACEPESTGTLEDTPTPAPSIPTVEGDYSMVYIEVITDQDEEIDIDGDGEPDNYLNNALANTVGFIVDEICSIIGNCAGIEGTLTAALNEILSVDTINAALADQLDTEAWLVRLLDPTADLISTTTVEENAWMQYWVGYETEPASGEFELYYSYGDLYGDYDDTTLDIDVDGTLNDFSIYFSELGFYFTFDLEMARTLATYDEELIEKAKLGGAISSAYLYALIDDVINYVGDSYPGVDFDQLSADIEEFVYSDEVSDVELEDGSPGISVNFIYDAEAVIILDE